LCGLPLHLRFAFPCVASGESFCLLVLYLSFFVDASVSMLAASAFTSLDLGQREQRPILRIPHPSHFTLILHAFSFSLLACRAPWQQYANIDKAKITFT
jgi:hypothetical protein